MTRQINRIMDMLLELGQTEQRKNDILVLFKVANQF